MPHVDKVLALVCLGGKQSHDPRGSPTEPPLSTPGSPLP